MSKTKALTVIKPEMEIENFASQRKNILELVGKQMKEDQDYGLIPGTDKKTLFQPGAEKLAKLFGLGSKFELIEKSEDFKTGFFYYRYKCTLVHLGTGIEVGNIERSCNSFEKKYRFRVVAERFAAKEDKEATHTTFTRQKGQYTNTYLRIQKTPDELYDDINTITAMAQKRALVAAVRTATMATDIFLDDVEDNGMDGTGPAKKTEDPARTSLISKLHAVAGPRGFNEEVLHKVIKQVFDVDSVTKLTNMQISSMIEKMLANYKEVQKGNSPEKIVGVSKSKENQTTDDKPSQDETDDQGSERLCYNDKCTKGKGGGRAEIGPEVFYCSDSCQDEYWNVGPENKEKKFNNFVSQGKS